MGPIGIMGGPVLLTFALALIDIIREQRTTGSIGGQTLEDQTAEA